MTSATKTKTALCDVCGREGDHAPGSEACGVFRWFLRGEVTPIDLAINLGLVMDLLRVGHCVVEDGQINRRDHYEPGQDGWREYRDARNEMLAALVAAEREVMDAAADEITARVGALNDDGLDYQTMAPASDAMGRRPIFRETFADALNWRGGVGHMLGALSLLERHVASDLVATVALRDRMITEINARKQPLRQNAVEAAQKMVNDVAAALWRLQYDRIQDIVDRMYEALSRRIGEIIGVDRD